MHEELFKVQTRAPSSFLFLRLMLAQAQLHDAVSYANQSAPTFDILLKGM